jgi:hypothetical protein
VSGLARAVVFDRNGAAIAEIWPDLRSVAWRLNKVDVADLSLPYTRPGCRGAVIRSGNRLMLEFDNGLPNWGGVIDFPISRQDEGVSFRAYGGIQLLSWRRTGKNEVYSSKSPGYIAGQLVANANSPVPTGISVGFTYQGQDARCESYHFDDVLAAVKTLAAESGEEWAVIPSLQDGRLVLTLCWYQLRGADLAGSVLLEHGRNVAWAQLDEQGPVYTRVIAIEAGNGWGDDRDAIPEEDAAARAQYGLREYAEIMTGVTDPDTLTANANAILSEYSLPRVAGTLLVRDCDPAGFRKYDVGDRVKARLFTEWPEWYFDGVMRVVGREWLPSEGLCRLEAVEWQG